MYKLHVKTYFVSPSFLLTGYFIQLIYELCYTDVRTTVHGHFINVHVLCIGVHVDRIVCDIKTCKYNL